jgi:hypothetical protein
VQREGYDVQVTRKQRNQQTQDKALKRRALDDALRLAGAGSREADEVLGDLFTEADSIAKTHSFGSYRFDRQKVYDEDKRRKRWQ